jgi:hypothetical protein
MGLNSPRWVKCVGCLVLFLSTAQLQATYDPFVGIGTTRMFYCEAEPNATLVAGNCAGDRNLGHIHDLASLPKDEPGMWAVTEIRDDALFELLYIKPNSPTARLELQTDIPIRSLAIDPTDKTFYGATSESLVRIDRYTGEVESIGALDMDHFYPVLAFDGAGNLFGNAGSGSELVAIDKSTALTDVIGDTHIRLHGIAFHPETDELLAAGFDGEYKMFSVDVGNASAAGLYPTLGRFSGLAILAVPEPSGSFAMAVALLFFAAPLVRGCRT